MGFCPNNYASVKEMRIRSSFGPNGTVSLLVEAIGRLIGTLNYTDETRQKEVHYLQRISERTNEQNLTTQGNFKSTTQAFDYSIAQFQPTQLNQSQ
jgi:hypothetical protein